MPQKPAWKKEEVSACMSIYARDVRGPCGLEVINHMGFMIRSSHKCDVSELMPDHSYFILLTIQFVENSRK